MIAAILMLGIIAFLGLLMLGSGLQSTLISLRASFESFPTAVTPE
jgi:hypothetical protein